MKFVLGESATEYNGEQIIVTTPGYIKTNNGNRERKLDFSELKMVIFDEADELLLQESNLLGF